MRIIIIGQNLVHLLEYIKFLFLCMQHNSWRVLFQFITERSEHKLCRRNLCFNYFFRHLLLHFQISFSNYFCLQIPSSFCRAKFHIPTSPMIIYFLALNLYLQLLSFFAFFFNLLFLPCLCIFLKQLQWQVTCFHFLWE